MKKLRHLCIGLLTLVLSLCLFGLAACGGDKNPGGDTPGGDDSETPAQDYVIETADELKAFASLVKNDTEGAASKVWTLGADIVLTGEWTPVSGFRGTFDGKFHKISGLTASDGGLFSTLEGAEVKNLTVSGTAENAGANVSVGLVAGTAKDTKIRFVTVNGSVNAAGRGIVGGIAGTVMGQSVISDCVAGASVSGAGSSVGSVVGELSDGAVLLNVYVSGNVESNGSAVGGVVGSMSTDSAIWQIAAANEVKATSASALSGAIVASVSLPHEYDEAYVIESYYLNEVETGNENTYGEKVSDFSSVLKWNSADWDLTGTPKLKTTENKTYSALNVTLDGAKVELSYGDKVPFTPSEENGVAEIGLKLVSGEKEVSFFEGLPVGHDIVLKSEKVDYSDFVGTWLSVSGAAGEKLEFGAETRIFTNYNDADGNLFTRDAIINAALGGADENAVSYFTGSDKYEYRLYFSQSEGLMVLEKYADGAWTAAGSFMPSVTSLNGVYADASGNLIITSNPAKIQNKLGWEVALDGIRTVATSKMNADRSVSMSVDGKAFGGNFENGYTFGTRVLEISESYFAGEWSLEGETVTVDTSEKKVKIGDSEYTYTVKASDNGVGISYFADEQEIRLIGTLTGAMLIADGKETAMINSSQMGVWYVYGENVYKIEIISANEVRLNDVTYDAAFIAGESGLELNFAADGLEFTLLRSSEDMNTAVLIADGQEYFALTESVVRKFFGEWSMGTQGFEIRENGEVTSTYYGETKTQAFRLAEDETRGYSLFVGDYTFYFDGSQLKISGYKSMTNFGKTTRDYSLYSTAEVKELFDSMIGTYNMLSSDYQTVSETLEFTAENTLLYNGHNVDYFAEVEKGSIYFSKKSYYMDLDTAVSLSPNGYGVILGSGYSAKLYYKPDYNKILGNYFVDFTDKSSSKIVVDIYETGLRVNYGGTNYSGDKLSVTNTNGTFKATVKTDAGDVEITFGDFTAQAAGTTYYNSAVMVAASSWSSSNTFYNAKGESLKYLTSSYSAPYAKFEYAYYREGESSLTTATSSDFTASRQQDGTIRIEVTFEGFADPVVLVVENEKFLSVSGTLFYSADKAALTDHEYRNGKMSVKVSNGKLYWKGISDISLSVVALDSVGKTAEGRLRLGFTAGGETHELVFAASHYVLVDGSVFVNQYLEKYAGGTFYDVDKNKIEFKVENEALNIYVRSHLSEISSINGSNMKIRYYMEYGIHEVTVDYSSDSRFRVTDYVLDDNNYYMSEAYSVYGGVYRAEDGSYFVIEENRVLYGTGETSSYWYQTDGKVVHFGSESATISDSGAAATVTWKDKVYTLTDFDRTQFYGTFYMAGKTSITINEGTFTDNSTVKGYTTYEGQLAIRIDSNKLAFLNTDPATKAEAPVIVVMTSMLDYVGTHTVNGKTLNLEVALVRNSDQHLESGIKATYDGVEIKDFAFSSSYCNDAIFTFNNVRYFVEINDDSETNATAKLLVYEEKWDDLLGSYTFNGMRTELKMKVKSATDCIGVLTVLYDSNATTDLEIGDGQLTFVQDGVTYLSLLDPNTSPKVMTFHKDVYDFILEASSETGVQVNNKTLKLKHSVVSSNSVFEVVYDGKTADTVQVLSDRDWVAFAIEGKGYILSLSGKNVTEDAFDTSKLKFLGTYATPQGSYYTVTFALGEYNAETKELSVTLKPSYGSIDVSKIVWGENTVAFEYYYYGTYYDYIAVYENGEVKIMDQAEYDLREMTGTFDIGGKTFTVTSSVSSGKISLKVAYDGAEEVAPIYTSTDFKTLIFTDKNGSFAAFYDDTTKWSIGAVKDADTTNLSFIGSYLPSFSVADEDEDYLSDLKISLAEVTIREGAAVLRFAASYEGKTGDVTFGTDGRLYFTWDGVEYAAWKNTASPRQVKMFVLPKAQAAFVGTHEDAKLSVEFKVTYSEEEDEDEYIYVTIKNSFAVTYDGTAATNVTFTAEGALTFTVGGKNYSATVKDGVVTVAEVPAA